jgi:hypothetical protein
MRGCGVVALVAVLGVAAAQAAPGAHQHGVARLSVAVDAAQLTIVLDAPLEALLGFERKPRNDAERQAAAALLARLRDGGALFTPDAEAGCQPGAVTIDAPVLAPGARADGEHADLQAQFEFRCARPQALRSLDQRLFDAFGRLQRIEVQLAGARTQAKATLQRPQRKLPLPP